MTTRKLIYLLLLYSLPLGAADIYVAADTVAAPHPHKIFDAFRAANGASGFRLQQIKSSLVRMFLPLTDPTGQYPLDVVTGVYPNFSYHFELADSLLISPIIAAGSQINLGYFNMAPALGPDPDGPPQDYQAWEEFNYNWALHFSTKYGIRYFEVWNEPDYSEFFTGSQSDYFQMYKYASHGILRAVPDARIGGPALAGNMNWVQPFLNFIITEGLPIHFISYHSQNNGYNDKEYDSRYQTIISALDARGMDSVQVHLNEFSYQISPATGSEADRSACAAWFAGTFQHILTEMPRLSRFNKTIIDNGAEDGKWENNGLLDFDGTPKAKFNMFRLYAMLPDSGLHCRAESPLNAMAAGNDTTTAVLIWNKTDQDASANLHLQILPFELRQITTWRIDGNHGSYYDNPLHPELVAEDRPANGQRNLDSILTVSANGVVYVQATGTPPTAIPLQQTAQPIATARLEAWPNPFNGPVNIRVRVNKPGRYQLDIYDMLGRLQWRRSWKQESGVRNFRWETRKQASGIYLISLRHNNRWLQVRKVLYIK